MHNVVAECVWVVLRAMFARVARTRYAVTV